MNFLTVLSLNYDKLRNKDMVNILWKEILTGQRSEEYLDQLIDYSFHYPVDADTYLQELNTQFDEMCKEELRSIDGHLKAYIITFLYYFTNRYNWPIPTKTTVLASGLYLKLILIPGIGKIFFEKNMFKVQLFVCVSASKATSVPDTSILYILKLLKQYCLQEHLDTYLLRGAANAFTRVLMLYCKDTINDIVNAQPLVLFCINSLMGIMMNEDDGSRLVSISESLFRCLREEVVESVPNRLAALSAIVVVIRDVLQEELDKDKFQYVVDAFCLVWRKEDFKYYDEAVVLMNGFKADYYKELIRKLMLYSESKNHKKYLINVMNLINAIPKNLPSFSLDKVEIFYSCALRNIVHHFVDKDKKVANRAIEVFTNLCMLKENPLLAIIFNKIQCNGKFINISVEALLLAFKHIVDEKWGTSPRNQNLLIILAKILAHSRNVISELVQDTLKSICKGCTPFSLKPSLPVLHELYCVMALKEEEEIAQAVLKIMYKCAMHQDATSAEFSNHIFKSLLNESVVENINYSPKYYYNIFLTSEFEYEALFTKCQKKISIGHIQSIIRDLDYTEPAGAVLLCCLLNYFPYDELNILADYFIENFSEIATRPTMGPLTVAFVKILKNKTISEQDVPQLDVIQSLILEALFEQTLHVPCIKPAFDLFRNIRSYLQIDVEDQLLNRLLTVCSERAFTRLHRREHGDDSVFMYLNEICLLLGKPPTESVLLWLETYMVDSDKLKELSTYMPDIYLQLLSLFTTLAMTDRSKIPLALKYLREVLQDERQIVKILAFKLLFSLSEEITHEFEEVVTFAFKEVIRADPCLVRICVIAIEELIHNDFIKLSSADFFKFVYTLGCEDLGIFMKEILMKRFVISNQNDIARYYVQSMVYMHMCSKLPNYTISPEFDEDLVRINLKINNPKEMPTFLFNALPIKKKFNVLCEIASIFDNLMNGQCKVETNFFNLLTDLIVTFKLMMTKNPDVPTEKHYYGSVCKQIEKQIVSYDSSFCKQSYYNEYEFEIKSCTLTLLNLLFFENVQLAEFIQLTLFDTIIHWVDFVKSEIVRYIYKERGKEYGTYFSKLVQYYKKNKSKFNTMNR